MTQDGASDEEDGISDEEGTTSADDEPSSSSSSNDGDDDVSKIISTYKSKALDPRRSYAGEARPGATSPPRSSIDVTMKFGGSSLANSERVDYVANLIKDRIHPSSEEEVPVRPRAGECFVCFFIGMCVWIEFVRLMFVLLSRLIAVFFWAWCSFSL